MEATPLLEIKPINPHVTSREFVPITQVKRIVYDEMSQAWGALLVDDSFVVLVNSPDGKAATDG